MVTIHDRDPSKGKVIKELIKFKSVKFIIYIIDVHTKPVLSANFFDAIRVESDTTVPSGNISNHKGSLETASSDNVLDNGSLSAAQFRFKKMNWKNRIP